MAASPRLLRAEAAPGRNSVVSLVRGADRRKNVAEALSLVEDQILPVLRTKKYVVVKPNVVSLIQPLAASNADALNGILDFLAPRFKGPVVIAESSAANTFAGYEQFGYVKVPAEHRDQKVTLVDLNDEGRYETFQILDDHLHLQPVRLAARLLDPDAYVICAGAMKTHNAVVATLSVKNMALGAPLRSGPKDAARWSDKRRYHVGIRQMHYNIMLTAQRMKPFWGATVVDGFEGMEGNGPNSGLPVPSRRGDRLDRLRGRRPRRRRVHGDQSRVGGLPHVLRDDRRRPVRPREDRRAGREDRRRAEEVPAPPGHRAHARVDGADDGAPEEARLEGLA